MTDPATELASQGRTLPPEERVRPLELWFESLYEVSTPEMEAAWIAETSRRVPAHERGEGRLGDARDVTVEAARIAL